MMKGTKMKELDRGQVYKNLVKTISKGRDQKMGRRCNYSDNDRTEATAGGCNAGEARD